MKSCINSVVILCSVLAASVLFAAAQDAQPPQRTMMVEAGNDLRCRLEKGVRITKSGEPITAKLVEPVYAATTIAIPEDRRSKDTFPRFPVRPLVKDSFCEAISRVREPRT